MYSSVQSEEVSAERERLILEHLPQVRLIARRIHERLPASVSLDDLVSSGVIGLIAAVDNFDPGQNVKLRTYAEHKIRGAILDSLRGLDWAPREKRRKARQIEAAITAVEQRLHRTATGEEIASELGVGLEEYHGWLSEVRVLTLNSFDYGAENETGHSVLDIVPDDEERWPSRLFESSELELWRFLFPSQKNPWPASLRLNRCWRVSLPAHLVQLPRLRRRHLAMPLPEYQGILPIPTA